MRFPRRVAATAVASTLAAAVLTGCTSDDEPGAVTDVVIGADLASGSAVDTAYARALQLRVEQLNASGTLVQTYEIPGEASLWSGLDLVGDGTFWAGNYESSNVYRFDLASGAVRDTFNTGSPGHTVEASSFNRFS